MLMNRIDDHPGGMSRPAADKPRGRDELLQWMGAYRKSVGPAAEYSQQLLQDLLNLHALPASALDALLELLELLQMLSADPTTVSCAIVHVFGQAETARPGVEHDMPAAVQRQLQELKKLKHYESGRSENSTERSAEGLRRLLLALVNDVRVVLIDLSWQLVLLRRAREGDAASEALARETMLIHAPLANRLGLWQLKWELVQVSVFGKSR
jgi:GTP pyrophosphokinase